MVVTHAERILNTLTHRRLVFDTKSESMLKTMINIHTWVPSLLLLLKASPIFWVVDFSLCHQSASEGQQTTDTRGENAHRGLHGGRRRVGVALQLITEVLGGRLLGVGLRGGRKSHLRYGLGPS